MNKKLNKYKKIVMYVYMYDLYKGVLSLAEYTFYI